MRRSAMFTLSTMHIPLAERQKIEMLISAATMADCMSRMMIWSSNPISTASSFIVASPPGRPPIRRTSRLNFGRFFRQPMRAEYPGCCSTGMNLHPLAGRYSMQIEGALRLSSPACQHSVERGSCRIIS